MENKIKAAFDSVHASEELKSKTRAFIAQNSCNYTLRKAPDRLKAIPVLAAAACIAVMVFAGIRLYFTPTTHINIDINPSLDLGINLFDRVVSVEPLNEDGKKLIETLDIKFAVYDEALRRILGNKSVEALLSEDEIMTVTVISSNNTSSPQSSNILSAAKACASGYGNVHCHSASFEQASAAQGLGMSYEKYLAYLELQALDPEITPEKIRNMTMREIRDLTTQLTGTGSGHHYEGPDDHDDHDNQNEHDNIYSTISEPGHHGNGHGHGYGHE